MTVDTKINTLRDILKNRKLDAYIINSKDSHDSEYTADYWHELEFITGFTGGEGTALVTMDEALIWVDSRYFIQCKKEIENTCFKMMKIDGPDCVNFVDYLHGKFCKGEKIGIDARTLTVGELRKFNLAHLNIKPCEDLIDGIWKDRPKFPKTKIVCRKLEYAGETHTSKIKRIREEMKKDGADYALISSLDDIAWILNLRASDLEYVPVFYAYLLIGEQNVVLFTSKDRFKDFDTDNLGIEIRDYNDVFKELKKLSGIIVLNPDRTNVKLFNAVRKMKKVEKAEYSTVFKMIKNEKESEGARQAHFYDALSLIDLMFIIHKKRGIGFSEYSIVKLLEELKSKRTNMYCGASFATISAFNENGAIVHYHTDKNHDKAVNTDGLLVLDCGSQYEFGTTDVTRTFLFGKPTEEQIRNYTAVLKAHLKLALTLFPQGTTAMQLDSLAKAEVWAVMENYYHGTGHGVGSYLCVHEGPLRISSKGSNTVLREGMLVTDEPGIYIEGKYGIRIENLMIVSKNEILPENGFMSLIPLTTVPYEKKLIDKKQLTQQEIKFINAYHRKIYGKYSKYLSIEEKEFLKEITKPL